MIFLVFNREVVIFLSICFVFYLEFAELCVVVNGLGEKRSFVIMRFEIKICLLFMNDF